MRRGGAGPAGRRGGLADTWKRLPRRKRRIGLTAGSALLFLVGTAGALALLGAGDETYRPGEEIEGLTAELARGLPEDRPRVTFTDVSEEAGVAFRHFGGVRSSQLPEDMGSGAAWGDYDGDDLPDLFVVNVAGPLTRAAEGLAASSARAHLYRNRGDGTFTEVAEAAGVDHRGWGMGATWADYDGDGRPDLLVTAYGENVLYRNRGDGTFEDVTREAGLAGKVAFWAGAAWADYDRDGDLDVYIPGYVRYSSQAGGAPTLQYDVEVPTSLNPSSFRPERNLLFRNEGNGTFTEAAEAAGVTGERGRSLQAVWADFDGDGWPDLYVANDVSDNVLYRNRGDGTFEDVSHAARVADYRGAMGLAVGDWDRDLHPDLFVTHWIAQENALYRNLRGRLPTLAFADEADRHGLGQVALDYIGWGTGFFDYDNDGFLDLFVANGSTFQEAERRERLTPMPDQLFWNAGPDRGFYEVSPAAGEPFRRRRVGRGAAFADYDRDGDVDVFVVNHGGAGALLRNDGGNANGWLQVRLRDEGPNPDGVGARLELHAAGAAQIRTVGAGDSYLSQSEPVAHFGSADADRADSLVVTWPDGERQTLRDLPVRRFLRILRASPDPETVRFPGGRAAAPGEASADRPWEGSVGRPSEGGADRPSEGGTDRPSEGGAGRAVGDGMGAPAAPARRALDREAVVRFWEVFRRATRHRITGRLDEAVRDYEAALRIDPGHEDALYYLGNVRLHLGDPGAAERAWRRLVEVNPRSARGHARLGALYSCPAAAGLLDLERAEAEYRRVREINAEQTGPLLDLARVALLRGDLDRAAARLEDVLGTHDTSADALFLRGYVAWKRGRPTEATARFAEASAAAEPVRAAGGFHSEGDTESGAAPMVIHGDPCTGIGADAGDLSAAGGADPADLARRAEAAFRRLEARIRTGLAEARGKGGSR